MSHKTPTGKECIFKEDQYHPDVCMSLGQANLGIIAMLIFLALFLKGYLFVLNFIYYFIQS